MAHRTATTEGALRRVLAMLVSESSIYGVLLVSGLLVVVVTRSNTDSAAVLAKVDDKQIQVSGHTDNSPISEKLAPIFPSNWELSAARAVNVVKVLADQKVPAARMLAAGYGEFHPVAKNANAQGRARNRRIEILLTPLLESKAAKEAP